MTEEVKAVEKEPVKQEAPSPASIVDVAKNAPRWAQGLAAVLGALVAVVLAFHIDIGSMMNRSLDNTAARQEASIKLAANQQAAESSNTSQILTALNNSLQSQSEQIAELKKQNETLRELVLRLQLQVKQLADKCGVTVQIIGEPTPTPAVGETLATPVPTGGNR